MNLEKFEKYGLNQLSVDERRSLEQEMTNNPSFFEDVDNFKAFLAVLDQRGLLDIKTKLSAIENALIEDDFFLTEEDLDTFSLGEEAEKKAIEKKIQSDPHYQSLAKDHQESIDIVDLHGISQLKKQIAATAQKLETEGFFHTTKKETDNSRVKIRTLSPRRIGMTIAAAVLLALGFFFFIPKSSQIQNLNYVWTQTHLDQAIADSRVAGLANTQKERLDNRAAILALVKNQQYEEAVAMWQLHVEKWPDDQLARLYYAHSLRETHQYAKAIEQFETLGQDKDFTYADDVLFHLALSYLQTKGGCPKGSELMVEFISKFPMSEFHSQAVAYRTQFENCP